MSTLLVFPQITLGDVYACVDTLGLDVAAFVEQTARHVPESTGDRDTDFVRSLFLSTEDLAEAGVDSVWRALSAKVRAGAVLSHPESRAWTSLAAWARKRPDWRTAHVIQPVGVRTLTARVEKPGWDFRTMPSDTLGAGGTEEQLVAAVCERLQPTTGGHEFLAPDPQVRALTVVATTVAAVLSEEAAMKSDHRRGAKLVRADIYEATVEGMGLGEHFQTVRRILEIDHPSHVPIRVAWPRPSDPVRDLGILEYRGQREPHLALNAPTLRKLR
jgi:hypothetical protein